MFALLLVLPAVALPVQDAWGRKPVLAVTLLDRWQALGACGLDEGEAASLRGVAEEVAAEADTWRREGDAAIRRGEPESAWVREQPAAVAALARAEADGAAQIAGGRLGCVLDVVDGFWQADRARSPARTETREEPGAAYTTVTLTYNVFGTQFAANTDDEVAIPDYCIKFANLGWGDCSSAYSADPYTVDLSRDGYRDNVWVGDVGPWNIDDNYWNAAGDPNRPRRLYTDLPQGTNEARAAYYDDYNGGRDQYGRSVSNPAGVDLAVEEAYDIGLAYLENDWMDVTFTWETYTIYPWFWMGIGFDARADQPADSRPEGASAGIYDIYEGQDWTARVYLGNAGTEGGRNVVLHLAVDDPAVQVVRWDVYTDYPYQDQASWSANSANDNAANPAHDFPGSSFDLHMDGYSVAETKLLVLTLRGGSPGAAHAAVRAWLSHVDDYYEKSSWDGVVTNVGSYQSWNGGDVRVGGEVDVWPRLSAWSWEDGTLEGWFAGNAVSLSAAAGNLYVGAAGEDPIVIGPAVSVAAAPTDTLSLRASTTLAGEARLYWSTVASPGFSEERALGFTLPADGAVHTLSLPLGRQPGWTGTVDRLRLDVTPSGTGSWVVEEIALDAASAGGGSEGDDTGGYGAEVVSGASGCACGSPGAPAGAGLLGLLGLGLVARRRR